jgi:hypothetical protein
MIFKKSFYEELNHLWITRNEQIIWKRQQWKNLKEKAIKIFKQVIKEAKEANFYENLYIISSDDERFKVKYEGLHFVQLVMGSHPTGISKIEYDGFNPKSQPIIEEGGALSIAMGITGNVVIMLFPCKSELHRYEKEYLLLDIFSYPCLVKEHHIKKAVKRFLQFCITTSYVSIYNQSWRERLLSFYLRKKEIIKGKSAKVVLSIVKQTMSKMFLSIASKGILT